MSGNALIIVDVQNDFLPPDGALAVPEGRQILPIIQKLLQNNNQWDIVIASQDYHPKEHISFATTHSVEPFSEREITDARGRKYEQTMWPEHCIIGSKGAEIDKDLRHAFEPVKGKMRIVRKGWHKGIESYSAFEGYLTDPTSPLDDPPTNTPPKVSSKETDLAKYLKEKGVRKVVVTGLATDFCVGSTARSSIEAGFETIILESAVRGIKPEGVEATLKELANLGGKIIKGTEWEDELNSVLSV